MLVCMYPDLGDQNLYIKNIVDSVNDEYNFIDFRELIKNPILYFKIKTFHFNWIENEISKNLSISKFQYIIKKIFILISRLLGKKIIWTYHNKMPHDAEKKDHIQKFMEFMMKYSNSIIIHCNESKKYLKGYDEKLIYIPHGNYIGNYKENNCDLRQDFNIKEDEIVYMFIGQIKKYKNIEILIEAFNKANIEDSKLLIVGNCKSEEYRNELENLNINKNIIFNFGFISNDEITKYFNTADILVFPYDLVSSLNSGSIIMSFSYKKTVISANIGTLKDIDEDFYYKYNYKDYQEHFYNLKELFVKTKKDFENDQNIFIRKGNEAYFYVKENNNWDDMKSSLKRIYL